MSDGYHLPTHLQQAEKVLDHKPAPKERTKPLRRKVFKRNEGPGAGKLHTATDASTVALFEEGKRYKFDVHNSIANTITRMKNMKFVKVDPTTGAMWFTDENGAKRYFRPSAVYKVKEMR